MTPAEKIAELRDLVTNRRAGRCTESMMRDAMAKNAAALLDIAEAAVARVDAGHSRCPAFAGSKCTCGHDNLAAKLAALGGG